jgi:PIN domain nuclease of toxin-antitoxin system
MYYLADTVALVWHLRGHRRLGRHARRILREADQGHHTIAISGVTLMEILYLSEGQRVSISLDNLGNLRPTLSTAPPPVPRLQIPSRDAAKIPDIGEITSTVMSA